LIACNVHPFALKGERMQCRSGSRSLAHPPDNL